MQGRAHGAVEAVGLLMLFQCSHVWNCDAIHLCHFKPKASTVACYNTPLRKLLEPFSLWAPLAWPPPFLASLPCCGVTQDSTCLPSPAARWTESTTHLLYLSQHLGQNLQSGFKEGSGKSAPYTTVKS